MARRLAGTAAVCVVIAIACGGPVDSNKGVLSAGGAGGMLNSGGVNATGGTSTGGVSSSTGGAGGVSSTGVGGSIGGYGGAASEFCPQVNFAIWDPTVRCSVLSGCATKPFSLPGCCLPSGECGALMEGVTDTLTAFLPPNGCDTYAQIAAAAPFTDVPQDPHQACSVYNDGGADASASTDASAPNDASSPPDSGVRDSTGDQGD